MREFHSPTPNRFILVGDLLLYQQGRGRSMFTIWVKNEKRAQTRLIVVCDATNVNAAMREALDQAAKSWACDANTLTIYGIVEGDISDLEPKNNPPNA
jgi:hypothetical protein